MPLLTHVTDDFYALVKDASKVEYHMSRLGKYQNCWLDNFLGFGWKCIKWKSWRLFEQIWYLQGLQISNSSFVVNSPQSNSLIQNWLRFSGIVKTNTSIPIGLSKWFQLVCQDYSNYILCETLQYHEQASCLISRWLCPA